MNHDPRREWITRLVRVLVRVLVLVVMTMLTTLGSARSARAQISPGKLARAHTSLEGASNCTQCHALSRVPMSTSCLNCHKDVKSMIDEKRGFHARISATKRLECASCHPDHAGVDFALIEWPAGGRTKFDHLQAGWALEGKHTEVRCENCHATKFRTSPVVALSKRKTGTPWIGLETSCASCHTTDDIHKGALKGGCAQCHDAKGWAPAPKFNHDDARFPLTGKHTDVKCDACHKSNRLTLSLSNKGEKLPLFRPVAFGKCSDCHTDPHQGRIREACTSCHETTRWEAIDKRGFNHAATRYPLQGRHAAVSCAACHGKNNERPTPSYASCAGCHADVHRGEGGATRDCASCHKVEGFATSVFTLGDHAKTKYPLEGKHTSVKCGACHTTTRGTGVPASPIGATTPGGTATGAATYVRLKMASGDCADCHADAHAGQAAVRTAVGGCTSCHTVAGFSPSTTTAAGHAKFRFALDGAHASATCLACHASDRRGLPPITLATGKAKFAFALSDTSCASCHADPHAGRYVAGGARAALGCRGCHGTAKFRPSTVTMDDHRRFGYVLEGAHRALPCAECHRELTAPAGKGSLRLSATSIPALPFAQTRGATCAGCHAEVHGAQFAQRRDKGACEGCHTAARFAGAERFDHEKQTRFPLAGAHSTVACAKCHALLPVAAGTKTATVAESALRQYAGVSMSCESCHRAKQPGVR